MTTTITTAVFIDNGAVRYIHRCATETECAFLNRIMRIQNMGILSNVYDDQGNPVDLLLVG